ncbi:MAG: glyoxalase [Verrucomicrobiota bacterium]
MIRSFDHIQLAMPPGGEGLARAFFVGVLKMVEEEKPFPLSEKGGAWFRSGSAIIHVGVEADFQAQRKAHPAFIVDDLDALASRLEANDFEVEWDEALPDRRRFFTPDPFGNRIEFIFNGHGFTQTSNGQDEALDP